VDVNHFCSFLKPFNIFVPRAPLWLGHVHAGSPFAQLVGLSVHAGQASRDDGSGAYAARGTAFERGANETREFKGCSSFFSLLVHPPLQSLSRVHAEARAARTPPARACVSCAHVGPTRGPHWDHSCSYRFSRASHVQHLIYFQTSRCNTCNIQNKTDEIIETCVSNT
jgi:hypothetical protein